MTNISPEQFEFIKKLLEDNFDEHIIELNEEIKDVEVSFDDVYGFADMETAFHVGVDTGKAVLAKQIAEILGIDLEIVEAEVIEDDEDVQNQVSAEISASKFDAALAGDIDEFKNIMEDAQNNFNQILNGFGIANNNSGQLSATDENEITSALSQLFGGLFGQMPEDDDKDKKKNPVGFGIN